MFGRIQFCIKYHDTGRPNIRKYLWFATQMCVVQIFDMLYLCWLWYLDNKILSLIPQSIYYLIYTHQWNSDSKSKSKVTDNVDYNKIKIQKSNYCSSRGHRSSPHNGRNLSLRCFVVLTGSAKEFFSKKPLSIRCSLSKWFIKNVFIIHDRSVSRTTICRIPWTMLIGWCFID